MTNDEFPITSAFMRKLNSFSNFQFPVLSFQFFHPAAPDEHAMIEDEFE